MNYIRHLQERHSRLLVLRVDLSWANEHKADITADDARKHRQQLFRNMQRIQSFAMSSGRYGNWNMAHNVNFITTCYLS